MAASIRSQYEAVGVQRYYLEQGQSYKNPHEKTVRLLVHELVTRSSIDWSNVLDLACGSGEVTLALRDAGIHQVSGIDPYTHLAYHSRTSNIARQLHFEDIAAGCLDGESYSVIISSFALHLLEPSRLPGLLSQLSLIAPHLIILSPHKRPYVTATMGWSLQEQLELHRVKARLFVSQQRSEP